LCVERKADLPGRSASVDPVSVQRHVGRFYSLPQLLLRVISIQVLS
jgi:hypothetical protein